MIGNHRDAWVIGAIDPSSATAVMMEIARVMGQLVKQGETDLHDSLQRL
jgi:Zn-dependent M28 family amino/carboxypeptidase